MAAADVYRNCLSASCRSRRHLGWLIELAHLLRVEEEDGQRRQARQVKCEVNDFLRRLTSETSAGLDDAPIAQHLSKTIRNRWWGLFICYRVPGLPATNNGQETFFNRLKQGQRRINGHKSVPEFIVRYGAYAAYLDPRETFDLLLARLRQVSETEFEIARQAWREHEAQLHKAYRFRHDRNKFLRELEANWEEIAQ